MKAEEQKKIEEQEIAEKKKQVQEAKLNPLKKSVRCKTWLIFFIKKGVELFVKTVTMKTYILGISHYLRNHLQLQL